MSRAQELHTALTSHPVYQQLVAEESALSYPVPSRRGGAIYLRFIVYGRLRAGRGQPVLARRPHARLGIAYPSGQLVEYADLRFAEDRPLPADGEPALGGANPSLVELSMPEVLAKRSALFESVDAVIPLLGRKGLSAEEREIVRQLHKLYDTLVEPALLSHYRALEPAFFDWLEAVDK